MKWAAIYTSEVVASNIASLTSNDVVTFNLLHGLMYSTIYSYTELNDVDLVDSFLSVCYSIFFVYCNQLRLLVFALNKAK